ncbi:MAG: LPS export ABC transporter periplasmic protein LptC [Candidatus Omnitrophota bacterium]
MKKTALVFLVFFALPYFAMPADTSISSSAEPASVAAQPQQMLDFNIAGYGAAGQKTWEVQGASMDMEGKDVNISDITAHLYGDKENMVLTADHGRFDKDTGIVYLKDNVRAVTATGTELTTNTLDWSQKDQTITTGDKVNITKENMTAQGQGIEAKPDLKIAKFEKDVVVTIDEQKNAQKPTEGLGFGKGKMVITCDGPMEMSYEKQYAIFQNNVKVDSEGDQGTMIADKMTITFNSATKQIDKMEATGNVKIVRGENTSYSDGAIFTASDKRLVLTGRPKLVMFTEEGLNVSP